MISSAAVSALSIGLPPSPDNVPATINIDGTCALFSLEASGRRVATASTSKYGKRSKNEFERETPRLHRILNLPVTARSNSSSLSSCDAPTLTTTSTASTIESPILDTNKNESTDAQALPVRRPREGQGHVIASILSAEQKVIKPPVSIPWPSHFTNSFAGNYATIVAIIYDYDEFVEVCHRRVYPSSTEPESEWCRGEIITRVPRRALHQAYDDIDPIVRTSTIEIVSPRPVCIHRYQETREWLQTLSRDLED